MSQYLIIIILVAAVFIIGIILIGFFWYRGTSRRAKDIERSLKMVPLLVKLPPQEIEEGSRDVRDVIKENIAKRQTAIGEYNVKSKSIVSEKEQWIEQKNMALGLEKTIDDKKRQADQDRAEWKKKQEGYVQEVKKWKTELDNNRSLQKKYNQLNK